MIEEQLFHQALELPAEQRGQFLEAACSGDPALRQRVEALLEAHANPGSFMQAPPSAVVATVDPPILERPGTQIGPYKLMEQIGEGGMGLVFVAEQHQPVRRKVALKVIKPGMDTREVIARFEAERQALALMDHPNIAHVLDAGATDSGRPYFVMELVKGTPITQYCDDNRLPPRERLELFTHVCHAVQHAHQKGIIHRDIKPTNVLVASHDGTPVVKVIDFGVAKAIGQQLTERTIYTALTQMVGTPLYMSPEQAGLSSLDIDTRTDVYSLGVLLYELLTGTTPFDKERLKQAAYDEMRRIIREEEPPKPSTRISTTDAAPSIAAQRHTEPAKLAKLVRGDLDWIVMKALDKDRTRRYETANGMVLDIEHYLHDEPVLACPPSTAYRFRKLVRRNKRVFAAAAATAVALVVGVIGLAVSNVLITQQKHEKEIALEEKQKALQAAKTNYEEARKQEALAKNNERIASEQREEAQANLKEALAAVDQMLTRVSEERLRHVPQMEPIRRDLLQDALKFYQRFLARRSDDPAIRRETALAYGNMGSLYFQLGDYVEAEAAYRSAFGMFDELDAELPLEPAIRRKLVSYYLAFGWTLRNQGKFVEGEQAYRRAVAFAEGLVKEFPDVPQYRDHLVESTNGLAMAIASPGPFFFTSAPPAQLEEAEKILRRNLSLTEDSRFRGRGKVYQNLGAVLAKQRRFSEAEQAYRQGVLLYEKALAQSPSLNWLQIGLAIALKELAEMVDTNGRPQEAEQLFRRAIPLYDQYAADFPAGPHHRWGQADIHFQHGLRLSKLKRSAEAEQAFRRTVELFDKLASDFPTLPGYRSTAVDRHHHLAQFLLDAGRHEEARQVYVGAAGILETLEASEKPKALKRRCDFYAGLGDFDKAAVDLTQAIELGSDDVLGVWYPLAVLHLHAGRTDEYRSLCERLLDQFSTTLDRWVVITCKLAPGAVADLSRPVQMAEKLVAQDREKNTVNALVQTLQGKAQNPELIGILGDTLYRKGDLAAAAKTLEASIHAGPKLGGVPWRKLFLAMAYHRLGRSEEARQLFQEVTQWIEANDRAGLSWAHWLDLQLTHREAGELLKQEFKE